LTPEPSALISNEFTEMKRRKMEAKSVYFEEPGDVNTNTALALARQRAEELGIKTILVASTTGKTAVKAMDILHGLRVIVATHSAGFREPDIAIAYTFADYVAGTDAVLETALNQINED